MEHYAPVVIKLEEENLKQLTEASDRLMDTAKLAIKKCKITLVKLRKMISSHGFPDKQAEIHFFKEIKPVAYSNLLYYQTLFELESFRTTYDSKGMKQCFKDKLKEIHLFMEEDMEIVQYYNCGFTHLDSLYFVRDREEIPVELRGEYYLMDEEFNTWQDYNFSVIQANEMLMEYLTSEILTLDRPRESGKFMQLMYLDWTAKKIYLVELIYALYFSRTINNGKITIKELCELFGKIFNIEIAKDAYRYFIEIQQRKIDQTKFIGHLKSVLQQQMDQNL